MLAGDKQEWLRQWLDNKANYASASKHMLLNIEQCIKEIEESPMFTEDKHALVFL